MSPLFLLACAPEPAAKEEYEAALAPDWIGFAPDHSSEEPADNFKVRLGKSDIEITNKEQVAYLKPFDADASGKLENSDLARFSVNQMHRSQRGSWLAAERRTTVADEMSNADEITKSPYSQRSIGEILFNDFAQTSVSVAELKEFADKYNSKTRVFNTNLFGVTLAQSKYLGCDDTKELERGSFASYLAPTGNSLGRLIYSLSFLNKRNEGEHTAFDGYTTVGQECRQINKITYDENRIPEFLQQPLRKMVYDYMTSALWLGNGGLRIDPNCKADPFKLSYADFDKKYVIIERGDELDADIKSCDRVSVPI